MARDRISKQPIDIRAGGRSASFSPSMIGRGQFLASGPGGAVTNVPSIRAMAPQIGGLAPEPPQLNPVRLAQVSREFRTRDQQAQVEQIQRQRERLAALRQRTAPLSMTREGRQRLADKATNQAQQEAKEARRFEENKELFRRKYIAPQEARARGAVESARVRQAGEAERQERTLQESQRQREFAAEQGRLGRESAAERERMQLESRERRERIKAGAASERDIQDRRIELTDQIRSTDAAIAKAETEGNTEMAEALGELNQRRREEIDGLQAPPDEGSLGAAPDAGSLEPEGQEAQRAAAVYDRLDAQLKSGKLTAAQADKAKRLMAELRKKF